MHELIHKHILLFSIASFLLASTLFTGQALAVDRPVELNKKLINSTSPNPDNFIPEKDMEASRGGEVKNTHMLGRQKLPSFARVLLKEDKLRACQVVSENIVKRSLKLVDTATKMVRKMSSVADGVEQFYLTKLVPAGANLSNYDALVADITTKENAALASIETAKTDATGFSCDGNNPHAMLTQFKTDMQAVMKAISEYRASVKNLITALRALKVDVKPSVTPTVASPSPTSVVSATPTLSLTPTLPVSDTLTPMP